MPQNVHNLRYNLYTGTQDLDPIHSAAFTITKCFLFYSSAASVLCLWYFWYFLPILHFITSPPILSAVFYHNLLPFLEGVREEKTETE